MSVINLKSKTDLSGFYVVYDGSVMNEYNGIYGISHLSEHLLCSQFKHLYDEFEQHGIKWNAYTSSTLINFHMTGLDEYVNKYKKVFLDTLFNFKITQEQFDNEKKIVMEEYKDSFNSQSESHGSNLMRKLFGHYGPIGSKEDLEGMTLSDMNDFAKYQYSSPSKIINVSKHSEFDGSGYEFNQTKFDNRLYYDKYDYVLEESNDFKNKSSVINLSKIITDDIPQIKVVASMLGAGLQSPLYKEIREKRGLVYYIHCYFDQVTKNDGLVVISSETSNDNVKEFQDVLGDVLDNPKKHLTRERFDIVKQSLEITFKQNEINRYSNVNQYLTLEKNRLEPVLSKMTYEDVLTVYDKYFKFDDFYKSIDKDEFSDKK